MEDPYPEIVEFEIDREGLLRYLRNTWFKAWLGAFLFMGGLFGLLTAMEVIERGGLSSIQQVVVMFITRIAWGLGISLLVGLVFYFAFSRRRAKRVAENLELRVEGEFLRLIQTVTTGTVDHKIHFGAVTDFSVVQTPRMQRHGIKALVMNTTSGGAAGILRVEGVRDCERVRDTLADIDRLRE